MAIYSKTCLATCSGFVGLGHICESIEWKKKNVGSVSMCILLMLCESLHVN